MQDLGNLRGVEHLNAIDKLKFILLNGEINNTGTLAAVSARLDWNAIVDKLEQCGVTDYQRFEIGDEQANG